MTSADSYVLVVDDEPDVSVTLQMILEAHGYEVVVAANGVEALHRIVERVPAVILLDMLMPVMNGWELVAELSRRYSHRPPIIVVTAAENARERAFEVGAEDYLRKPFDVRALLDKIAALVTTTSPQEPGAQ
ncbi:response regulator transcription factor [Paraliomyxa miuraensis]|uniref:response regulator transcription factor n=1 Tax=Paraliomyxa miuraensis TaxID=376150 RepID=UPI002256748B|nr:response regulator [Paraliomyxa miuraensis]MCX4245094.1 response regulator [Paraliomyxa miuraensis]